MIHFYFGIYIHHSPVEPQGKRGLDDRGDEFGPREDRLLSGSLTLSLNVSQPIVLDCLN